MEAHWNSSSWLAVGNKWAALLSPSSIQLNSLKSPGAKLFYSALIFTFLFCTNCSSLAFSVWADMGSDHLWSIGTLTIRRSINWLDRQWAIVSLHPRDRTRPSSSICLSGLRPVVGLPWWSSRTLRGARCAYGVQFLSWVWWNFPEFPVNSVSCFLWFSGIKTSFYVLVSLKNS